MRQKTRIPTQEIKDKVERILLLTSIVILLFVLVFFLPHILSLFFSSFVLNVIHNMKKVILAKMFYSVAMQ